jgi:hypothetical protein
MITPEKDQWAPMALHRFLIVPPPLRADSTLGLSDRRMTPRLDASRRAYQRKSCSVWPFGVIGSDVP